MRVIEQVHVSNNDWDSFVGDPLAHQKNPKMLRKIAECEEVPYGNPTLDTYHELHKDASAADVAVERFGHIVKEVSRFEEAELYVPSEGESWHLINHYLRQHIARIVATRQHEKNPETFHAQDVDYDNVAYYKEFVFRADGKHEHEEQLQIIDGLGEVAARLSGLVECSYVIGMDDSFIAGINYHFLPVAIAA